MEGRQSKVPVGLVAGIPAGCVVLAACVIGLFIGILPLIGEGGEFRGKRYGLVIPRMNHEKATLASGPFVWPIDDVNTYDGGWPEFIVTTHPDGKNLSIKPDLKRSVYQVIDPESGAILDELKRL
jgi:hypothetical protein